MAEENILHYELSPDEARQLRDESARLATTLPDATDPAGFDRNPFADAGLPDGLRGALERFRRTEDHVGFLVHGFPVDDDAVGATPEHWERTDPSGSTREPDHFLAMCSTALGDPYNWLTLQLGRMVQDVLPIRGDEDRPTGHGSEALLELHTEDCFHPDRCDYLLLLGMRNDEHVPTALSSVRDVKLSDEDLDALMRPDFYNLPDDEHIRQLRTRFPDHPALARAEEMERNPEAVPVLFGDRERPYVRVDQTFTRCVADRPGAQRAFDNLIAELERVQQAVVIDQGTLLIVDNYLAVHGRKPFRPKYDGRDRWLKRMIVSRDLRKASASILPDSRRVLF